jgi:lipopolysaccharide transport system permease protein
MIKTLQTLKKNIHLIITFSIYDLKKRYLGTLFGLGWYFIWAFLNIILYTIIFAKIIQVKLPQLGSSESYGLYLALGILPWNFFSNVTLRSSTVFFEFKHLLSKTNIPITVFLSSIYISEVVIFLIGYIPLLTLITFLLKPFFGLIFLTVLNSFLLGLFGLCLGFFVAVISIFFKDFMEFFKILIHFLFWLTPIVYVKDILPEKLKEFLIINPLESFIEVYHSLVFPDINLFFYIFYGLVTTIVICLLSKHLWKRWEEEIRDLI